MNKAKVVIFAACLTIAIFALLSLQPLRVIATVADIYFASSTPATGVTFWQVMDTSADASTATLLMTAQTDKRFNVTRVIISCVSAITVNLEDGDGTVIAGPYRFATGTPGLIDVRYLAPRKVNGEQSLYYQASGAGAVTIEVEGFTSD